MGHTRCPGHTTLRTTFWFLGPAFSLAVESDELFPNLYEGAQDLAHSPFGLLTSEELGQVETVEPLTLPSASLPPGTGHRGIKEEHLVHVLDAGEI